MPDQADVLEQLLGVNLGGLSNYGAPMQSVPIQAANNNWCELGTIKEIFEAYPRDSKDYEEIQRAYVTITDLLTIKPAVTLTGGFLLKVFCKLPLGTSDIDIYPHNLTTSNDRPNILKEIEAKLGVPCTKIREAYQSRYVFNFTNEYFTRIFQINFMYSAKHIPDFVEGFDFPCCMIFTYDDKIYAISKRAKADAEAKIIRPYLPCSLERIAKYMKAGFKLDPDTIAIYGPRLMQSLALIYHNIDWMDANQSIVCDFPQKEIYTKFNALKEQFKEIINQNTCT